LKRNKRHIISLLFFLFLNIYCFGQEKKITIHVQDKNLNEVLQQVAANDSVKFAFDADYFSNLKVTLNYDQIPVTNFLKAICDTNHLLYEKIDNTYVLYKNPAPLPPKKKEYITLEGQVIDKETGEPLLFCNIGLGENQGMMTNELGIFSLKIEKTEHVQLAITHLGYQRLDTTLQLIPKTFYKIALTPFAIHIAAIDVHQQEKNVIEMGSQSDRMAFNPKQSENLPRIDDSDLITALGLIPGVNFLGGQTSGISIRGGSPSENLILLDGMPVLETSHLFGNLSVLNAKYISQAFVSRGAFDATHGEHISGVIQLHGKDNYYKPSLDLSANLLNVNATAEIPIGKVVSISGAYRKSYIDQWENYLYRQILEQGSTSADQSSVVPSVVFDDTNVKISAKPTNNMELSLNAFQSNDSQLRDFIFSENSRFYRNDHANSKNRGISGNWKYQPMGNWQFQINAGYNELHRYSGSVNGLGPNKQGKGGKEQSDSDDNQLKEFIGEFAGEWKTGAFTHQFGFGLNSDDVSYIYLNNNTVGNVKVDSINYSSNLNILHAYLQEKFKLKDKLHARIGIRVNQENTLDKFYLQPRWGITYFLAKHVSIFYNGGIYNQFLSRIRKIDSSGNSDLVWYLPDSTGLGVLQAQQHVLGFRYENHGLAIDLEPYYKKTTGRVNLYTQISGKKEKYIEYVPREGESENYGVDVMLHLKQGLFTHMLNYSLSKSYEQFSGFNNNERYPAFDDQLHRVRWTEMARYKTWVAATNLTYHTGSPYLISQTDGSSAQEFGRLPYFMQADFSLIKRFNYQFFTLSTGVSLLNLFNRQNVLEVDYFNISDNTGSYSIRTDITALKFTPVFFINMKLR